MFGKRRRFQHEDCVAGLQQPRHQRASRIPCTPPRLFGDARTMENKDARMRRTSPLGKSKPAGNPFTRATCKRDFFAWVAKHRIPFDDLGIEGNGGIVAERLHQGMTVRLLMRGKRPALHCEPPPSSLSESSDTTITSRSNMIRTAITRLGHRHAHQGAGLVRGSRGGWGQGVRSSKVMRKPASDRDCPRPVRAARRAAAPVRSQTRAKGSGLSPR